MKIVVLDDSKTVLLTIYALLEELGVSDECISLFSDGGKALEHIEQNGADIIFSDINMPGMDGFEFVGRLFALSQQFVSMLFIVSADEHCGDINHMKHIGAKRFLRKPINSKHFNHFVAHEIARVDKRDKELDTLQKMVENEVAPKTKSDATDYEALAMKIGIKVKHIPALIESFLEEAEAIIKTLHTIWDSNEYATIERCAHSLKGSAGNMQFSELYEMARELEFSAKNCNEEFDYVGHGDKMKQEIRLLSNQWGQ